MRHIFRYCAWIWTIALVLLGRKYLFVCLFVLSRIFSKRVFTTYIRNKIGHRKQTHGNRMFINKILITFFYEMFIQEKPYTLTFSPIGNYSAFDTFKKKEKTSTRISVLHTIRDIKLTSDICPDTLLLYFRYLDPQLGKERERGSLW